MNTIKTQKVKLKAKRTFLKKGTCSRTFFYLLNREFGHPIDMEEHAIDPLAGGILQQGYQCGMVWGASMAIGAEAFRRTNDLGQATDLTIKATQNIIESFTNRAKSIECEDVANCDWQNKWSMAKHFLTGKFISCYFLAGKWAPEAIKAANEGLSIKQSDLSNHTVSCASEVVKKMGGSKEEMAMVAGFAGGLALNGSGCGALAAAIWMNTLARIKNKSYKMVMSDPITEGILQAFFGETDYEMECHKICGKKFKTIDEHTEFIKNGGCKKLIDVLAEKSVYTPSNES